MALRKGLLVFSLALIASFQWIVATKRGNSDKSNYNILVNHLVNLKGIERCNIFIDWHVKSRMAGEIQAKLVKSLPIMAIKDSQRVPWEKYRRREFYYVYPRDQKKFREQPAILNSASGESLLIYFYQPSRQNYFHNVMKWFQTVMIQPASIPKVLIVAITNKPLMSYKTPSNSLFKIFNIVDAEILEISDSVRRAKKKNTMLRGKLIHRFSVHRYNPFTRIYKKQKLTKRVKWFQTKTMDLHGFRIKTDRLSFVRKQVVNNKTFLITSDLSNQKSKFATAVKSLMNITYTCEDNEANQDLAIYEFRCICLSGSIIALKPRLLETIDIYTPVIFDTKVEVNLTDFLQFFPLILTTVLLLSLLTRFSQFNRRTWSPLAIFKMLLGLENPTGVTGSLLETLLFILFSFTGFFFSNEFSNAVTGILNPITIERHFNTFQDIKDSNITMYLWEEPLNSDIAGDVIKNPILKSEVKYHKTYIAQDFSYRLLYSAMRKMFCSSNISLSFPEGPLWVRLLGSTIQVDGRTLIKRSGISEVKYLISCRVKPFSPYNERMSDIYWRFYEAGFHNMMNLTAYVTEFHRHIRREYFLKTQQQDLDDSVELDINFCAIYCGILLVGSSLAILVLIVEILLADSYSSVNQSKNNRVVSIEDDANFVCFTPEFYEYQEPENAITGDEDSVELIVDNGSLQMQNDKNENDVGIQHQEESTDEIVLLETFDIEEIAED